MGDLVPLASVGAAEVEALLDEAFGHDRHQRTAYRLRAGTSAIDTLSFAFVDGDTVIGSIQCWPVRLGDAPLILVGPVAVLPSHQNRGIGGQLMNATLTSLEPHDPPTMMIGDPEYYGRFGFVADDTGGWQLPGPCEPHRLLLRNPQALKLPETGLVGPRRIPAFDAP